MAQLSPVIELVHLPNEVLHNIFKDVRPWDLAAVAVTCRTLRNSLQDRQLFKEVYMRILDEPPGRPKATEYDWIGEVHKYVKMCNLMEKQKTGDSWLSGPERTQRLPFVADTVTSWLRTASSSSSSASENIALLTSLFQDKTNQEDFFQHSTIFSRARRDRAKSSSTTDPSPLLGPEERQFSAKLHTLYGVPIQLPRRTSSYGIYPYACSVVYDLRNYTEDNFWGPFKNDGLFSADWERLEAIMIVLGHNLKMFMEDTHAMVEPLWQVPWLGASPDTFASGPALNKLKKQPAPPPNALDPFGVTGTWMRVVCFLDFSELFAYNAEPPPRGEPRRPIETTEAIRLIIMEIDVDRIDDPSQNGGLSPIVYFKGTSRSMHSQWDPNANSNIRGSVRLTKEGEVRWNSVSVYNGEERWNSEGIQIGGPKSSRGVLGHWFDKDHDEHGPAGPTAFWKVSNEIKKTSYVDFDDEDDDANDPDFADDEDGDTDDNDHAPENTENEYMLEVDVDVTPTEEEIAAVLQHLHDSGVFAELQS